MLDDAGTLFRFPIYLAFVLRLIRHFVIGRIRTPCSLANAATMISASR